MKEFHHKLGLDPRVHRIPNRFRVILVNLLRARKRNICECRWTNPPPDDLVLSDGPLPKMCECGRPFDEFTNRLVSDVEEKFSQEMEAAGCIRRGWRNDPLMFFTHDFSSGPHRSAVWQLVTLDATTRRIRPVLAKEDPDLTLEEIIRGIMGDRYDEDGTFCADWEKMKPDIISLFGVKNEEQLDDARRYFECMMTSPLTSNMDIVFVSLLGIFRDMLDRRWVEPELVVGSMEDRWTGGCGVDDFEWEDDDD